MTGYEQGVRKELALAAIAASHKAGVIEDIVNRVAPLICPDQPPAPRPPRDWPADPRGSALAS